MTTPSAFWLGSFQLAVSAEILPSLSINGPWQWTRYVVSWLLRNDLVLLQPIRKRVRRTSPHPGQLDLRGLH
ncbi:uncharacterized protein B0H18DRAFT_988309, partial [Fomitopsis serialis]|uniref:uncharacterized protein n=1 Tax=Fomitopsis serialis TaxID=139415 RepID=UPI002007D125